MSELDAVRPSSAKRILIPIDFTDHSRAAFYVGLELAARTGAETMVLHVAEPTRSFDLGKRKYVEMKETIERVEEGVKRRIDELWEGGGLDAVDRRKVHILVRGGKAYEEICATAEAQEVDLIVMGHGQRRLGSVAERVLRYSSMSVYCVKLPQFEEA